MAYRFGENTRTLLTTYGLSESQIALAECYEETARMLARPRPSLDAQYKQSLRRQARSLLAQAKK